MWNTWTFYQCIIVHISSTSPCYSGNDTFLKRKGDEERFLWNHPSASAHTPSGPPLVPQTIDTWAQICQMRLESSLKWPRVEYSSDSSRTCSKKWRPNPPTTKVYKKSFSHILLSLSWRNQSSDFRKQWRLQPDFCHLSGPKRSSDNSVTEMTHWRTCQWADPTDLTQRVLSQTWPSPMTPMKNNHGPRGQLDVFALDLFWEQMPLLGKGLRPLAHSALSCLEAALLLTM